MIDCPNGDVRDALPDYLHDRLDTARRREVESHLAGCEACREELSLLRALRVTMRRAPAVDVNAIASGIPPYRAPAARGWATSWRAAAAIVAIAVGGASIALLRGSSPAEREDVTAYVQSASAPNRGAATTIAAAPPAVTPAPPRPAPSNPPSATAANRELAIEAGAITDLSDRELSALVEGIESLDAVPSTEVEADQPMPLGRQEDI